MTTDPASAPARTKVPRRYGPIGSVLLSIDFVLALPIGVGLGILVGASSAVQASIRSALLFTAPAGLALGGIMLGASSVLPGLMDSSYRVLIERTPTGMKGVTRPFKIVARIAFATSLSGLVAVVAWPAIKSSPGWLLGTCAGVPLFLFSWTALGAAQLVGQGFFHLESKTELENAVGVVKERHRQAS